MKIKYLLLGILLLLLIFFAIFSKKEKLKTNSIERHNITNLSILKTGKIREAFHLRAWDSGFIAITGKNPYLISFNLDTVQSAIGGSTYYFQKLKDTILLLSEDAKTFTRITAFDTTSVSIGANEGYIEVSNNDIYYAYQPAGISKNLEQQTLLCRKNIASAKVDTLVDMNIYLKQLYPFLNPEEYAPIGGGAFYTVNNQISFLPYGVNAIFLFKGKDTITFKPLSNKQVIRWKTNTTEVPGQGTFITLKPTEGNQSHLNFGVFYFRDQYLIPSSSVVKNGSKYHYFIDCYSSIDFTYKKSYQIIKKEDKDDYLISFALSKGYLASLSVKGNINLYLLP